LFLLIALGAGTALNAAAAGTQAPSGTEDSGYAFRCSQCSHPFTNNEELQAHVKMRHADQAAKMIVAAAAAGGGNNETPEPTAPQSDSTIQEASLKCPYRCLQIPFASLRGLYQHIRKDHPDIKHFKCPYKDCTEAFRTQPELKKHMSKCTDVAADSRKPRKRNRVDGPAPAKKKAHFALPETAPSDDGTEEAQPAVAAKKGEAKQCPECGKLFAYESHFARHMTTHTGERPCICTVPGCGKAFTLQSNLTRHMKTHITSGDGAKEAQLAAAPKKGEAKQCPKCGESFAYKSYLTRHMRKHTGERPYICRAAGCGKAFTLQGHLTRHMTAHTGMPVCTTEAAAVSSKKKAIPKQKAAPKKKLVSSPQIDSDGDDNRAEEVPATVHFSSAPIPFSHAPADFVPESSTDSSTLIAQQPWAQEFFTEPSTPTDLFSSSSMYAPEPEPAAAAVAHFIHPGPAETPDVAAYVDAVMLAASIQSSSSSSALSAATVVASNIPTMHHLVAPAAPPADSAALLAASAAVSSTELVSSLQMGRGI
jgi:uncharacterized Zn-finger protein